MKNFKPGQKVVYSTEKLNGDYDDQPEANFPKEKEIVTIEKMGPSDFWWMLVEYPKSKLGGFQAFNERVLFPIEEISKEETEKIIEKLNKSIKQLEPQYL